jgi:S1-C subfamily serine protease
VVLLLADGEQQGSGVVLHRDARGTWVVTNRHVVEGFTHMSIRSSDGRLLPGQTLLPKGQASTLDLAFVRIPRGADSLPLARLAAGPAKASPGSTAQGIGINRAESGTAGASNGVQQATGSAIAATASDAAVQARSFAIVTAGGYPAPDQQIATAPMYREFPGLLLPLLTTPLQGGMQLATTSPVRKGMSGGGLFDDSGALIGITTTHANPLWSGTLRQENGTPLPLLLSRQLELVALAIPIARVLPLLDCLTVPQLSDQIYRGKPPAEMTDKRQDSSLSDQVCSGRLK